MIEYVLILISLQRTFILIENPPVQIINPQSYLVSKVTNNSERQFRNNVLLTQQQQLAQVTNICPTQTQISHKNEQILYRYPQYCQQTAATKPFSIDRLNINDKKNIQTQYLPQQLLISKQHIQQTNQQKLPPVQNNHQLHQSQQTVIQNNSFCSNPSLISSQLRQSCSMEMITPRKQSNCNMSSDGNSIKRYSRSISEQNIFQNIHPKQPYPQKILLNSSQNSYAKHIVRRSLSYSPVPVQKKINSKIYIQNYSIQKSQSPLKQNIRPQQLKSIQIKNENIQNKQQENNIFYTPSKLIYQQQRFLQSSNSGSNLKVLPPLPYNNPSQIAQNINNIGYNHPRNIVRSQSLVTIPFIYQDRRSCQNILSNNQQMSSISFIQPIQTQSRATILLRNSPLRNLSQNQQIQSQTHHITIKNQNQINRESQIKNKQTDNIKNDENFMQFNQKSINIQPKQINERDSQSLKYNAIKSKLNNLANMSNELFSRSSIDINQKVDQMIQEQIKLRESKILQNNQYYDQTLKNDKQGIEIIIEKMKPSNQSKQEQLASKSLSKMDQSPQSLIKLSQSLIPEEQSQKDIQKQLMLQLQKDQSHLELIQNKIDQIKSYLPNSNINSKNNEVCEQNQVEQSLNKEIQNNLSNSTKQNQRSQNELNSLNKSQEKNLNLGIQLVKESVQSEKGDKNSSLENQYIISNPNNQIFNKIQENQIQNEYLSIQSDDEKTPAFVNQQQNIQRMTRPKQNINQYLSPKCTQLIQQAQNGQNQNYEQFKQQQNNSNEINSNQSHQSSKEYTNFNILNPQNKYIYNDNCSQPMQRDYYNSQKSLLYNQKLDSNEVQKNYNQQLLAPSESNKNINEDNSQNFKVPLFQLINPSDKSEMMYPCLQTEQNEEDFYNEENILPSSHKQYASEISQQLYSSNEISNNDERIHLQNNKNFVQTNLQSTRNIENENQLNVVSQLETVEQQDYQSNQNYINFRTQSHLESQQKSQQQEIQIIDENYNQYPNLQGENHNQYMRTSQQNSNIQDVQQQYERYQKQSYDDEQYEELDMINNQKLKDTFDLIIQKNEIRNQQQHTGQFMEQEDQRQFQQMQFQQLPYPMQIDMPIERRQRFSDANSEISQIEHKITCENVLYEDSVQKTRELKDKLQRIYIETGMDIEKYVEKLYHNLGQSNTSSQEQLIQIIQQGLNNPLNQSNDKFELIKSQSKNTLNFNITSSANSMQQFDFNNNQNVQSNQYINQNQQQNPPTRNRQISEFLLQKQDERIKEIEENETFQKKLMKRVQRKPSLSNSLASSSQQNQQNSYTQNQFIMEQQEILYYDPNQVENEFNDQNIQKYGCVTQSFQTTLTNNQQIAKEYSQQYEDQQNQQVYNLPSQVLSDVSITQKSQTPQQYIQYTQNNQINQLTSQSIQKMGIKQSQKETGSEAIKSTNSSQCELSSDQSCSSKQKIQNQAIKNDGMIQMNFDIYQKLQQQNRNNDQIYQNNQQFNQKISDESKQQQITNQTYTRQQDKYTQEVNDSEHILQQLDLQELQNYVKNYLQNINIQKKNYKKQYKNLKQQYNNEQQLIMQSQNEKLKTLNKQSNQKIEFYLKDIKAKINYIDLQKTDLDKKNFNCTDSKEIISNYFKYSSLILKGIQKINNVFLKIKQIQIKNQQQSLDSTINFNPMIDELINNNLLKSEQEWEEIFKSEQIKTQVQEKMLLEMMNKYNQLDDNIIP